LSDAYLGVARKVAIDICKRFCCGGAISNIRVWLRSGTHCFRVLGPRQVGYLDLGGSGNETHAHLAADGRITLMFCNFRQPALILRIYGRGRPVLPQDVGWAALALKFTLLPGTRQIFLIDVESVQTRCSWGRAVHGLRSRARDTLTKYHRQADPAAWVKKLSGRTRSIYGLPTRATDRFIAGEEAALVPLTAPQHNQD
jgi:hypothetical protein